MASPFKYRRSKIACAGQAQIKGATVIEAVDATTASRVACVQVNPPADGKPAQVAMDAKPELSGGQVETKLYEKATRFSCKRFGAPPAANTRLSPAARKYWERQVKKGKAKCDTLNGGDCVGYTLACPPSRPLGKKLTKDEVVEEILDAWSPVGDATPKKG